MVQLRHDADRRAQVGDVDRREGAAHGRRRSAAWRPGSRPISSPSTAIRRQDISALRKCQARDEGRRSVVRQAQVTCARSLPTLLLAVVAAAPSWTLQRSGVTARLRGVSAASDRVVWASGSGNTILRSEDGGATWRKLRSPRPIASTSATSTRSTSTWPTCSASATARCRASTRRPTPARPGRCSSRTTTRGAFLDAMAFWDEFHGIVVSDSVKGTFVIMTTDNGGRTWTRVPAGRLPPALPNEGAFAASGTNIAVLGRNLVWFGTGAAERARVLRSTDRGATWQIADTPLHAGASAGIYSVAFRDAQHGVVVGGDYAKEAEAVDNVAVTSDGGKTWTLVKEHGLARIPFGRGVRAGQPRDVSRRRAARARTSRRTMAARGRPSTDRDSIRSVSRPAARSVGAPAPAARSDDWISGSRSRRSRPAALDVRRDLGSYSLSSFSSSGARRRDVVEVFRQLARPDRPSNRPASRTARQAGRCSVP